MGLEPVHQLTARDRNRLALQSDMMAASVLGVRNILLMSGDHPALGDHAEAMPVYDLDAVQLINAAKMLNSGRDLKGNDLKGATDFFIGAVVNPNLEPFQLQLMTMKKKIDAGAVFFQTQVCFDVNRFLPFIELAHKNNVKIMPSIALFSSAKQLELFHALGTRIPEALRGRMTGAPDMADESIRISADIIKDLKKMAHGVHIIALNCEERIPRLFEQL
jgi:5,10-methylenetetrahydrofolate reductase